MKKALSRRKHASLSGTWNKFQNWTSCLSVPHMWKQPIVFQNLFLWIHQCDFPKKGLSKLQKLPSNQFSRQIVQRVKHKFDDFAFSAHYVHWNEGYQTRAHLTEPKLCLWARRTPRESNKTDEKGVRPPSLWRRTRKSLFFLGKSLWCHAWGRQKEGNHAKGKWFFQVSPKSLWRIWCIPPPFFVFTAQREMRKNPFCRPRNDRPG